MTDRRTRPWPAIVGLVAIAGIVLVVLLRRGDDDKPHAPAPPSSPATSSPASPAPVARSAEPTPSVPDAVEEAVPDQPQTVPEEEKRRTGLNFPPGTDPAFVAEVKEQRKDWKPLDYDEMVAKSKPFLETLALREELLEKEIAEAEKAGDDDKAARRRVELERVRQRKKELEAALAKGKIP